MAADLSEQDFSLGIFPNLAARDVGVDRYMWHTSRGDRTLDGSEAELIAAAIDVMVGQLSVHIDEEFEEDSAWQCPSGVAAFDALSVSQRIGLLHDVAFHLLIETESTMPLSAAAEATVAAIFTEIRDQVAIEIDLGAAVASGGFASDPQSGDRVSWRRRVLAAHHEVTQRFENDPVERSDRTDGAGERSDGGWNCGAEVPEEGSQEMQQWDLVIESLADNLLWDRDFEMAESFLDIDPGVSRQRRRLLGIHEDYFTQIAPDPLPHELPRLISQTRRIVQMKPR